MPLRASIFATITRKDVDCLFDVLVDVLSTSDLRPKAPAGGLSPWLDIILFEKLASKCPSHVV